MVRAISFLAGAAQRSAVGLGRSLLCLAGLLWLTACADAQMMATSYPSKANPPAYAQAFVQLALNLYDELGREDALAYYNSAGSVDGAWYVFIVGADGTILAHPTEPDRVGRNVLGLTGVDSTGDRFGPRLIAATETGRWVRYRYVNPATGAEGRKHTWVVRHEGLYFASGWYEAQDVQAAVPMDDAAYTQAFVQQAIDRYDREGRLATLAYYNSPESVDGAWYLFIIDADGIVLTHATVPENVGASVYGPLGVDSTGLAIGPLLVSAPETGAWVDYRFVNPDAGEEGLKHSWVVQHDGLYFGSGWYEPN